jgi:small-conductance mechanosensitive channel
MSWTSRLAALLMAALLLCGTAFAQQDPDLAAAPPAPTVAELRALLAKIDQSTDSAEDARSRLTQINAIGAQADKFVAARTGELNDLNARLGELGNPPAAGASEDPDITRQRARLTKERNALDADIRLAKLLAIDVRQRGTDLLTQRRAVFEAQLTERAASPLTGEFWSDLQEAWPDDLDRLQAMAAGVQTGLATAIGGAGRTLRSNR